MNAVSPIVPASLSEAMAVAFGEIEAATKASVNPAFKQGGKVSKYADLTAIIEAIKPALIRNGLFFTQRPQPHDHGVCVETVIGHKGGEELSLGTLYVPANKNDAQGFGSALTYARRYALVTAFGVPVEDDDGNAAVRGQGNSTVNPAVKEPAHSALKTAVRQFVHELNGCGDSSELQPLLDANKKLIADVKAKIPDWWEGWPEQPDGFTPLRRLIEMREYECAQATVAYATA